MYKKYKVWAVSAFITLLLASTALAADVAMTMHRIEQRYKDDYKMYPLSPEDVVELEEKSGADIISAMKLAGYYFTQEKYDKSYYLYEECAKSGDLQARFMLALSRLNGRGIKSVGSDFERESINLLVSMIDDHPLALYLVAQMQADGYKQIKRDLNGYKASIAEAKQKGVTEETIVFQAKYDKMMASIGYGRYGVKDTSGTLAYASNTSIPAVRSERYDEHTNPTPELKALFGFLTEKYGTPEKIIAEFGDPQIDDVIKETAADGTVFTRRIMMYQGLKAVFIDIGKGLEWERLVSTGNRKISFNGLKIGAPDTDVLAITGMGNYVVASGSKILMTDKMRAFEFAEFEVELGRVKTMKAYKIFE